MKNNRFKSKLSSFFGLSPVLISMLLILSLLACANPAAPATNTPAPTKEASKEVIKWKLQSVVPITEPNPEIGSNLPLVLKRYVAWVNEVTNGRLVVSLLQPDAVVPVMQSLAAVGSGALDAAFTTPLFDQGTLGGIASIARGLPGAITTPQELRLYYNYSGVLDIIQKAYGEKNVFYSPAMWSNDFSYLTKFPVTGIASFSGKKVRALALDAAFITKVGGSPVTSIGASDLYMSLQTGIIDGAAYGCSGGIDMHLDEVIKYIVVKPLHYSAGGLIINKNALAALPDDIRNTIVKYSQDMLDIFTLDDNARLEAYFSKYEKKGVKLVRLADEETVKWQQIQRDIINDLKTKAQTSKDTYFLDAVQKLKY